MVIILIVALAVAKYVFDWSVIDFIKSPKVQDTLSYVWNIITVIWSDFIVRPIVFIYHWLRDFIVNFR